MAEFVDEDGDESGEHEERGSEDGRSGIRAEAAADDGEGDPEEWLDVDGDAEEGELNHVAFR